MWATSMVGSVCAALVASVVLGAFADARVIKLDEGNWTLVLEDEWMLDFMAPWCPACTSLKSTWEELGLRSKDLGINVAEVDVTTAPGLSGRFLVTALPTIYHVINGEFRQYKGPRDRESLYSYLEAKRWKNTDPVPWWKDPNSVQMSYVSYFFRMSQMLRVVHNVLLENYGLPTWGSYLVFALATILLGSLIGLLMVACIDLIYPQKSSGAKPPAKSPPKEEEVDIMNDDLEDDAENSEEYESQDSDKDGEKNSPADSQSSDSDVDQKKPGKKGGESATSEEKKSNSSPVIRKRKN